MEKKPHIPEQTRREMALFFQKRSVPRILAERKKQEQEQNKKDGVSDESVKKRN